MKALINGNSENKSCWLSNKKCLIYSMPKYTMNISESLSRWLEDVFAYCEISSVYLPKQLDKRYLVVYGMKDPLYIEDSWLKIANLNLEDLHQDNRLQKYMRKSGETPFPNVPHKFLNVYDLYEDKPREYRMTLK